MNKKLFLNSIFGIGLFTIAILVFICYSNDHVECEELTENTIGVNGEKISTTRHICKEKFNF